MTENCETPVAFIKKNVPGAVKNNSWLYSEPARRTIDRLNRLREVQSDESRVVKEASCNKLDNVRRNLTSEFESDNAQETENAANVTTHREWRFELDESLLPRVNKPTRPFVSRTPSNVSERSEYSLTSYDSSIFDPSEIQSKMSLTNDQDRNRETERAHASHETGLTETHRSLDDINLQTSRSFDTPQNTTDELLQTVLRAMNAITARITEIEARLDITPRDRSEERGSANGPANRDTTRRQRNVTLVDNSRRDSIPILDHTRVTYGRTEYDVRNRADPGETYLRLKDAVNLIPPFDGKAPEKAREFLNACSYAVTSIHPADEIALLRAVLCTKLRGKALLEFETKNITDFEQLRKELELNYSPRKNIAHLQVEFNSLKQKANENAQAYGQRVEQLALELYESMTEGQNHSLEEKRVIMNTINMQALNNYQAGLRSDIKILVRSQRYTTLSEAISGASAEEKTIGPSTSRYNPNPQPRDNKNFSCLKCGKRGHYAKDCRSGSRNFLPKPENRRVNVTDKYCNYCKKPGHKKEECWLLNGKFNNKVKTDVKQGESKNTRYDKKRINAYRENDSSSSDEDYKREEEVTQAAELQVTMTDKVCLDLVSVPIKETKTGTTELLYDTGATISLIKVQYLKGQTPVKKLKMKLTGVTGHTAHVIGKFNATIKLKSKEILHTMYIVKNEFPINYQGILGNDFIKKYNAVHDHRKGKLVIGKDSMILYPYNTVTLPPRCETIIQATTGENHIGIVRAEETQPGIFIGSCLVQPDNHTCPVSVVNTTEATVRMRSPHVHLEAVQLEAPSTEAIVSKVETEKSELDRQEAIIASLRTQHLNKEEERKLKEICEAYSDIFHLPGETLTYTDAVSHSIPIKTDTRPINVKPYRLPSKHKEEVDRQIKEMLENALIRPSKSQWNAPLLVVPKKIDASGKQKLRVVIDFRKLNDVTIGDSFPLPNITDILDQLGNAKYFSTLDLASGYHQIPMAEADKDKTAFSTPYGHFEYNRMPFGLKNAPATFQRLMNAILVGMQGIKCFVYLDDIVIYGASLNEHNERLIEVFDRLRKNNLKLQPDKCEFLRKEVIYLGHIITENGILPDPRKIEAVKNFSTPKKVKEIQAFIGLAGYYRKFIDNFSKIARPLTRLTKKDTKFTWGNEQQKAFEILKEKLITAPILMYPDFTREFIVTTDASGYAIGAILSQGEAGKDKPIAYASRVLKKAEQNYSTTEKELLAIVWAVNHFRPYLYGTKFKIITDHKALIWLFNVKDPGSRLIRWRLKLEEYDYEIIYKKGKANANADALSRYPVQQAMHTKDASASETEDTEKESNKEYTEEEKQKILYEYHNTPLGGHQGTERTIKRIRLLHNWPNLTRDVRKYIEKCDSCQKNKLSRKTKMPLIITDTPHKPFEKCALDIVGPLPVTRNDNKYLLTFQDNLTKFSKAIPIPNQEANTIAKEFTTKIICEHGIPEVILTDQGTNFMSEIFKSVCNLLKINKIQTTAYHPESNGALERSHRTLIEYIRHFINNDQTDWDEWIPFAIFTYNTTPHTATGFTPFELVYGRQAQLPTALTKPPATQYNLDNYANELKQRLRAANKIAHENLSKEKQAAKQQYDKKINNKTFKVGDRVLLFDETLRRGRSKKLEALWIGPYTILEKTSKVNYVIKKGRRTMQVHANRIKHLIEN